MLVFNLFNFFVVAVIFIAIDMNRSDVTVNFPEQTRWTGLLSEMERVSVQSGDRESLNSTADTVGVAACSSSSSSSLQLGPFDSATVAATLQGLQSVQLVKIESNEQCTGNARCMTPMPMFFCRHGRSDRCCDSSGDHVRTLRLGADPRAAPQVPRLRRLQFVPAVFQFHPDRPPASFQPDKSAGRRCRLRRPSRT